MNADIDRANPGVQKPSILPLVGVLGGIFLFIGGMLSTGFAVLFLAYVAPALYLGGLPVNTFGAVYIPFAVFLVVVRFRKMTKVYEAQNWDCSQECLYAEVFYWVSAVILPLYALFADRTLTLGQGAFRGDFSFVNPYAPALACGISSLIFLPSVGIRKKHILPFLALTMGCLILFSLPILKFRMRQSRLDPAIRNFATSDSFNTMNGTVILLNLPEKDLMLFSSNVTHRGIDKINQIDAQEEGLKHGSKIGWIRKADPRIHNWRMYDFDASDAYLYSPEFMAELQSRQATKYGPVRALHRLMEADPDTPFYRRNK